MDTPKPVVTFLLWSSPGTHGPPVTLAPEDVVAVTSRYAEGESRALLHLRGGSLLVVCEGYREAIERVYGKERLPECR